MASKKVKALNQTYHQRYVRKTSKGAGIYATGLPGTPNGIHLRGRGKCRCVSLERCRCGNLGKCRCGNCIKKKEA